MKKITAGIIILLSVCGNKVFAQFSADGSYIWNITSITYALNDKTEFSLGNKDHYNNQIDRLDYYHFGIDLYYCNWQTRSTIDWKGYNVLGISTKVRI